MSIKRKPKILHRKWGDDTRVGLRIAELKVREGMQHKQLHIPLVQMTACTGNKQHPIFD